MSRHLQSKNQALANVSHLLNAVSPLAVLGRCYSLTTREDGAILRDTAGLAEEDTLKTRLASGSIISRVVKFSQI